MSRRKEIKRLNRILSKVKVHKNEMSALSSEALAAKTAEFKTRLAGGETLDDILPEAFAVVCEADYRILGKYPYDVQIMGGIAVHEGNLIEMNTGEGKTLMATMPLYLNALTGKSTLLLTTNEYLAIRDAEEMGQVYRFMGLTVGTGAKEKSDEQFTNDEKRAIYASDIVYTTHGAFGFDYLLNNLVTSAEDRFMRELYYVIIDEADSVLLDASQMPLVISGSPRVQSNLYELADFFVTTLVEGRDYEKEDQKVWFTEEGIAYTERFFQIENFYGEEYFEINRHVTLALRAHVLFESEKDYVVSKDRELQLLDNGSGRMMPGVKLRGGQHQALEVKEKLELSQENRSVAAITYQNLFLMFPKMSGMSGTLSDAAEELQEVYGLKVIVIPPNRPLMRKDSKDLYYKDVEKQFSTAYKHIVDIHKSGQPVLVVVSTIGETEMVSKLLINGKIPHNVLNANNAFWEAEIIKEAGQMHAVTVATAMAGRGTDIQLGEGVKELGGLAVIGIGRMANIRQERQARGRSGRQGDPGFSRFFVSLQDEIVKKYGKINTEKYEDGTRHISKRRLRSVINASQRTGEEFAVSSRKQAMDYDKVMQRQRELVYATRDSLMDGEDLLDKERIVEIAQGNIEHFLKREKNLEKSTLTRYILDNISYRLDDIYQEIDMSDKKAIMEYLLNRVREGLEEQEEKLGSEELLSDFLRVATLQAIDNAWVEEVDYLQQLQSAVAGRSSAQRKPVYEYQKDALESFGKMEQTILQDTIRNVLLSNVYLDAEGQLSILLP